MKYATEHLMMLRWTGESVGSFDMSAVNHCHREREGGGAPLSGAKGGPDVPLCSRDSSSSSELSTNVSARRWSSLGDWTVAA